MFSEIITERLCLRSLIQDDAEQMFAYRSNPDVSRYQSWEPASIVEVRAFINRNRDHEFNTPGWHQLGIERRADMKLVGDCGIHILKSDPRICEFGISIACEHQSQGYASEAMRALLDLVFVTLAKHRVFASVDPRNASSTTLLEKLGLRKEGHFIQSLWLKGEWRDDVIFALLSSEWRTKNVNSVQQTQAPN